MKKSLSHLDTLTKEAYETLQEEVEKLADQPSTKTKQLLLLVDGYSP